PTSPEAARVGKSQGRMVLPRPVSVDAVATRRKEAIRVERPLDGGAYLGKSLHWTNFPPELTLKSGRKGWVASTFTEGLRRNSLINLLRRGISGNRGAFGAFRFFLTNLQGVVRVSPRSATLPEIPAAQTRPPRYSPGPSDFP